MPVCSNCGGSDFVWAENVKTGGFGRTGLSLRSGGELALGTRVCRGCGHADLFVKDPTILRQPHTWRPGEFVPIPPRSGTAPKPSNPASPATPAPPAPAPSAPARSPSPAIPAPAPSPAPAVADPAEAAAAPAAETSTLTSDGEGGSPADGEAKKPARRRKTKAKAESPAVIHE